MLEKGVPGVVVSRVIRSRVRSIQSPYLREKVCLGLSLFRYSYGRNVGASVCSFFFSILVLLVPLLSLVLSSPIQLCSISLWVRAFIGICTAQLYVLSKRYLHSYVLGRLQQPAASARSDQSCSCPSSSQQGNLG